MSYAALAQIRVMSVSRLYGSSAIGQISKADFRTVRKGFNDLYCFGTKDITEG